MVAHMQSSSKLLHFFAFNAPVGWLSPAAVTVNEVHIAAQPVVTRMCVCSDCRSNSCLSGTILQFCPAFALCFIVMSNRLHCNGRSRLCLPPRCGATCRWGAETQLKLGHPVQFLQSFSQVCNMLVRHRATHPVGLGQGSTGSSDPLGAGPCAPAGLGKAGGSIPCIS